MHVCFYETQSHVLFQSVNIFKQKVDIIFKERVFLTEAIKSGAYFKRSF